MIDDLDIEATLENTASYCFQCEQTPVVGCVGRPNGRFMGICGKDAEVAALIDFMCYVHRFFGKAYLSADDSASFESKFSDDDIRTIFLQPQFMSITNANFDAHALSTRVDLMLSILRDRLGPGAIPDRPEDLVEFARENSGVLHVLKTKGKTVGGLLEAAVYGIRGAAAYAEHVCITDGNCNRVRGSIWDLVRGMGQTLTITEADPALQLVKDAGKANLEIMEALDQASFEVVGKRSFTTFHTYPRPGPAIIVSGHDLIDLGTLLERIEERGLAEKVSVYTHGEMLPAHGYESLRAHSCLAGHLGTSWANQRRELRDFKNAVALFTTNCILKQFPEVMEADRIFTTRVVGLPGAHYVEAGDWDPVIDRSIELGGFTADECALYQAAEKEKGYQDLMAGGDWRQVLAHAPKILELIEQGKIEHFLFCGGCDANSKGREYFTELVAAAPKTWIVLTSGCGRFRVHRAIPEGLGDIEGIPRCIDVGQCNDTMSAIKIAIELAKALGCEVNQLPLSLSVQHFEQKAVAIFCSLVYLGIERMYLGPTLPRYLSAEAVNVLVEALGVRGLGTVEEDIAKMKKLE